MIQIFLTEGQQTAVVVLIVVVVVVVVVETVVLSHHHCLIKVILIAVVQPEYSRSVCSANTHTKCIVRYTELRTPSLLSDKRKKRRKIENIRTLFAFLLIH